MNLLELILGSICLVALGVVIGITITCCAGMSGREDKKIGINEDGDGI